MRKPKFKRKAPKVIRTVGATTRLMPSGATGKVPDARPEEPFYETDEARAKAIEVLEAMGGKYDGSERVWFRDVLAPKPPLKPTAPNATVYYDLHRGSWRSSERYIAQNQIGYDQLQEKAHTEGVFAGVLIRERISDTWIPEWAKATGAI